MTDDLAMQAMTRVWKGEFVPDAATRGREFIAAFTQAVSAPGVRTIRDLEVATVRLARWMRQEALPPERGVVILKGLAAEAKRGWTPSLIRKPGALPSLQSDLYSRAFSIWVATFYRG